MINTLCGGEVDVIVHDPKSKKPARKELVVVERHRPVI